MSIFETLSSKIFLDQVFEYCYFKNSFSNRKTQNIISRLYYSQINNRVAVEDNLLITQQAQSKKELADFWEKTKEYAYVDLKNTIHEEYEKLEEKPLISQEEMDYKTREAAIRLGYLKE